MFLARVDDGDPRPVEAAGESGDGRQSRRAVTLFGARPEANLYLRVDDFNIYLIVLNNLVSFTTSVFSASYIAHELETGRLTPAYLRFYHAMYQALLFAMNLALLANNIGLNRGWRSNWRR